MFSNPIKPSTSLKSSLQTAILHNHRMLLVLDGASDQHASQLCELVESTMSKQNREAIRTNNQTETQLPINIMHVPDRHSNSDISDQINALLGSEYRCVYFDAHDAFNERLFAACTGTILAGGILVLRTPSLAHWATMKSPPGASGFMTRLVKKIHTHQTASLINPTQSTNSSAILIGESEQASNNASQPARSDWETEQRVMVKRVLAQLQRVERTTTLIQADRGRGKSALIGQTVHALSGAGKTRGRTITLTANQHSACAVLLKHATGNGTIDTTVQFLPIDQALNRNHDILIVEEAGSISIPVLTRLTSLSHDIVFATTVQGYEGAGRGFALRFSKLLNKIRPGWLMLEPTQPIRWSTNDPLEAFVNDAFLLKTSLAKIPAPDALLPNESWLDHIDKGELSNDDQQLTEIYSLLIQAHYQTTPSDLRNMMDEEQLLVFAQRTNNVLTGAALVSIEGDIPLPLHQAIVNKERRIRDQIIPQLLAQCAAEPTVLSQRYARVVRIAIHPTLHRRGFGTALFGQLQNQLAAVTQTIGASFGADEQSLGFWLQQKLIPIHYGFKANPRSGLRSACLVRAEDALLAEQIEKARQILHANLGVLDKNSDKTDLVRQQLLAATDKPENTITEELKKRLIKDFCRSNRSFIDTVGLIETDMIAAASSVVKQHYRSLLQNNELHSRAQQRISEQVIRDFLSEKLLP